jgi:hypothetical protein
MIVPFRIGDHAESTFTTSARSMMLDRKSRIAIRLLRASAAGLRGEPFLGGSPNAFIVFAG